MTTQPRARALVAILFATAGSALAGDITMLPSLGGSESLPRDINNNGVAVGEALLPGDAVSHAVLWKGGVATDLGAVSGSSAANAINDAEQIVGWSDTSGYRTCLLWENGAWTDIGADMNAAGPVIGWDINAGGTVVGQASLNGGFAKGFVWEGPGTGRIAGTVDGYNGSANLGVNDDGVTAGHGFFFGDPDRAMMGVPNDKGGYDAYDIAPPGYTFSIASDVNNRGLVVGYADVVIGPWQAAIFTLDRNDPVELLGTLPDLENSEAYGVNEDGVIVGSAWDNDLVLPPRAFIYFDGAMHDLNDYLEQGQSDWIQLYSAEAINDNNEIVGYGLAAGGEIRGFVMTGVVPPACHTDLNGDGKTDTQDFLAFLNLWVAQDAGADWNGDHAVDTLDFLAFLNEWSTCR